MLDSLTLIDVDSNGAQSQRQQQQQNFSRNQQTTVSTLHNRLVRSVSNTSSINQRAISSPIESQLDIFQNDPLSLLEKKVPLALIHSLEKEGTKRGKKLAFFYKQQNEQIDNLLQPVHFREEGEAERLFKLKIAVYGSLVANILLFLIQLYGAISTGSISIFATLTDAFMDLASNVVLIYTGKVSKEENNPDKYPTGKGKMETAGIIVFACLMSTLSIQLIIEAVRALLTKDHAVDFNLVSFIAIGIAIFTKFLLFIFCQSLRRYPSANILAQDHRNDIILNSFGVTLSILGAKIESWIDPAGGILIALLIFQNWSFTCYENILLIVGKSADNKFLQKLTYIALTHDDRVRQVDTIRAYTSGNHYFVEVDIVLPPDMTLKEAHDIGESLQIKFETLENVDRAFVHLDFESEHKPEHQNFLKKIK